MEIRHTRANESSESYKVESEPESVGATELADSGANSPELHFPSKDSRGFSEHELVGLSRFEDLHSSDVGESSQVSSVSEKTYLEKENLLRSYAQSLVTEVKRGSITDKEALARVAERAATLTDNPRVFVNLVGMTLSNTGLTNPGQPLDSPRVPNFGDTGFQERHRDDSNQLRHFAAAMVAGAAFGFTGGTVVNTGREAWAWLRSQAGASMADVLLGNKAAALGDSIVSDGYPKLQDVGRWIRDNF